MTISPRFDVGFLSYSLGQFSDVGLQRYLRRKNWEIYSAKCPNQTCVITHNVPDTSILAYVSWYWMTLITWPRNLVFFDLVWPQVHTRLIYDFDPSKFLTFHCLSKQQIKRCVFSNFCIWCRGLVLYLSQGAWGNWWISRFPLMPEWLFSLWTLRRQKVKRYLQKSNFN